MNDAFISMLRDIDLLYGFIHECAYLINNLYEHNNYGHLVKKLCDKFVLPIINITKDKHKKCNCHCKQNNRKFVCLTDKYIEFCKEDSIIFKKIIKSYFNVEYIKYLYLLQKAADQIISKKLNLYDENTCIRKTDTLINMFIILYNNSNIDCNKKVESKIYNLYQQYTY